jgi:lysophospholipase L1-like esterase
MNTSPKPAINFSAGKNNVVLFGDSIFFGVGATRRQKGCGYLLKQRLDVPVELWCRPGIASNDAIERLNAEIANDPPRYIIIMFGNNDCRIADDGTPAIPKNQFRINLRYLVMKIREHGRIPVLCNLQPIDSTRYYAQFPNILQYQSFTGLPIEWQNGYSEIINVVASETDADFIDIRNELLPEIDRILSEDGLHPNDYGHKLIADILYRELKTITSPSYAC